MSSIFLTQNGYFQDCADLTAELDIDSKHVYTYYSHWWQGKGESRGKKAYIEENMQNSRKRKSQEQKHREITKT